MKNFSIAIIFLVSISIFTFAATSADRVFSYRVHDGLCSVASGGGVTEITIEAGFIRGPCGNLYDDECCLQVCQYYNVSGWNCELKPEYRQTLEQKIGPIDEYVANYYRQQELVKQNKFVSDIVFSAISSLGVGLLLYLLNRFYFKPRNKKLLSEKLIVLGSITVLVLAYLVFQVI